MNKCLPNHWPLPVLLLVIVTVVVVPPTMAQPGPAPPDPFQPAPQQLTSFDVPEGGVDELGDFLIRLLRFRPTSLEQQLEFRRNGPRAIREAAERIVQLDTEKTSPAYRMATGILLQERVGAIPRASAEEQESILDEIRDHFTQHGVGPRDIGLAMAAAQGLERGRNKELAYTAYQSFGEIFAASADPSVAGFGKMMGGAARRLNLIGNTIEIQGQTVDGEPFDLESYRGKVVLVHFWATWCGACRAEFPNVKRLYEQYQEDGFEVVGISLDEDRRTLDKYLANEEIPWITLHEQGGDGRHPAANYYGVMGIPAMFLVDRSGEVISLHARGQELTRLLATELPGSSG